MKIENWFVKLFGFAEPEIYQRLHVEGARLIDQRTGRSWNCGRLEMPSLAELRERNRGRSRSASSGGIQVQEAITDATELHINHPGAMIQAASQFNLLEMASPSVTPEAGVTIYGFDRTQGPACAVACGAGTVYRNYFVRVGCSDEPGQTAGRQINTLEDIEAALWGPESGSSGEELWRVKNGYLFADKDQLGKLNERLSGFDSHQMDSLRSKLRVGLQWETQVTLPQNDYSICHHLVSQAYCAAIPIGYNDVGSNEDWHIVSQMILDATYEAIFWAALEQLEKKNDGNSSRQKVFLTLVGGGVFGNPLPWIIGSIGRQLAAFADAPLDVSIVSHGKSKPEVQELVYHWSSKEAY